MIEAITPAELSRRGRIEAKLFLGAAQDLSDAEIARCLSGCCSPTKLIRMAKRLRDAGELSLPSQ